MVGKINKVRVNEIKMKKKKLKYIHTLYWVFLNRAFQTQLTNSTVFTIIIYNQIYI